RVGQDRLNAGDQVVALFENRDMHDTSAVKIHVNKPLTPALSPSEGERIRRSDLSRLEPLNPRRERSAEHRLGQLNVRPTNEPRRCSALRLPRKSRASAWKSTNPLSCEVVAQRAGRFMGRVAEGRVRGS